MSTSYTYERERNILHRPRPAHRVEGGDRFAAVPELLRVAVRQEHRRLRGRDLSVLQARCRGLASSTDSSATENGLRRPCATPRCRAARWSPTTIRARSGPISISRARRSRRSSITTPTGRHKSQAERDGDRSATCPLQRAHRVRATAGKWLLGERPQLHGRWPRAGPGDGTEARDDGETHDR